MCMQLRVRLERQPVQIRFTPPAPRLQPSNHHQQLKLIRGGPQFAADRIFPGEDHIGAVGQAVKSLYKFSRPHTIIGTALSVCSISLAAVQGASNPAWGSQQIWAVGIALSSALLANISIVGTNQCFDIDIDKINKPYLPLASGEWTLTTGITVSAVTGILASAIAIASGSVPLIATVLGSIVLGVAYSADVPLLRWKKHPLAAATCILVVRAVLVQVGFWKHMEVAGLGGMPGVPNPSMLFLASFMTLFSIVIALFKDIPDVRGDQLHATRTAPVRFGTRNVFWVCISLLLLDYSLALGYIAVTCDGLVRILTLLCQASFPVALLAHARDTDLSKHADLVDMYMFVWKLFYAQYLLFPSIACGNLRL